MPRPRCEAAHVPDWTLHTACGQTELVKQALRCPGSRGDSPPALLARPSSWARK